MNFSLIVPAAAHKPEYDETLPLIFRLSERGVAHCIEAILGLDTAPFTGIFITILRRHDERFGLAQMLRIQLDRAGLQRARIVVLDEPTTSQASTVHETIVREHITGPVFIKDADSYFHAEIRPENGMVIYPLERLSQVNPQHKSYVAVDDMQFITNTIERRVIDHYFNAGGYCFDDTRTFCRYYERLTGQTGLYLSHIVYAMLLDGHIFRPFMATDYQDMDMI